jgi:hypothetical protein
MSHGRGGGGLASLNGKVKRSGLSVEVVAEGVSMFGRRAAVLYVLAKHDGVEREREVRFWFWFTLPIFW